MYYDPPVFTICQLILARSHSVYILARGGEVSARATCSWRSAQWRRASARARHAQCAGTETPVQLTVYIN